MKKIKLTFMLFLSLMGFTMGAQAQEVPVVQALPQLPVDKAVRIGILPNGMTYYIRHNNRPEHQAFFYIVQKVGSVQEQESQRGLAHFLEHMSFNGTKNFPGNALVNYCERIGVKFGEDLNAYTSTDETVYNIDNVPVTPANIDSCLLILHDWSHNLLLESSEIDKERGVIHEEWRLRSSAQQRMLERNLEKLYPGSRYGRRMPIGLMSIVDNFAPDTLRAYYRKWYRPDLQAIIVVGDINVNQVEEKVKQLFSDIPNPKNEAKYEHYPVPDNHSPIYVIDKDKEQKQPLITIYFKHDVMPMSMRNTPQYFMLQKFTGMVCDAINNRLEEESMKPDCPFLGAEVTDDNYLLSKTKDAFTVYVVPKPGKDMEAVKSVMAEIERVRKFGITDTEINRISEEDLSQLEKTYNNRDKQNSSYFIPFYVRNFLEETPMMSIQENYETTKNLYQQLKAAHVMGQITNELAKELTARTDTNLVVTAFYPEKEGVVIPTEAQLRTAIQEGLAADVTAYVDNVKNEPLIAKLPKKGKVVKTEAAPFGYTKWTLSNGTVVYSKQTDFNASQVLLSAHSWGGSTKFNMKDPKVRLNYNLLSMVDNLGLGNFSSTELDKALAGKQVSLSTSVNYSSETINGNATPKDLRTMFEMLYLKFTKIGNDREAYNTGISMMKNALENAEKVPETAMSDSVNATIYNHDVRTKRMTAQDLALQDYNLVKKMYGQRFKAVNDFTFYITGNFNNDSLRDYLEQYVATLPKGKVEKAVDPELNFAKGVVVNRFKRNMETPKGSIRVLLHGKEPFSIKNSEIVNAFAEILSQRLLKSIREDAGIAYSVGASGNLSKNFKEQYYVMIFCPVQPAHADKALNLMDEAINDIVNKGVTEEELDKVKKFQIKSYKESQKQNSYWSNLIQEKVDWNVNLQAGYEKDVESIQPKDIQNFAKNVLLKQDNKITVVMLPESLKE